MTSLEQIQQDIQTLPEDALNLLARFIQLLKKSHQASPEQPPNTKSTLAPDTPDWSDFIGCMDAEADLSVNYKALLHPPQQSFAEVLRLIPNVGNDTDFERSLTVSYPPNHENQY